MKSTTKEKIIQHIKKNPHSTASAIAEHFNLGRTMTHRHLKRLIEKNKNQSYL